MIYFKIRTKLKDTLGPEMATNGQYALEHILDAIGKVNPSAVTASYVPGDRTKAIVSSDIIELITLWSYGYDLKGQDMRAQAMICKLLDIKI
jgi:hypothetical protein